MMNVETAKTVFQLTGFNDNLESADKLLDKNLISDSNFFEVKDAIKEAKVLYNPLDEANVGDGATVVMFIYSERMAGTIINRSKKSITIQMDKATLLNAEELRFETGGFAAHCVNQNVQRYQYERDTEGKIVKATRRKDGSYQIVGTTTKVIEGRSHFYDYNF